MNYLIMWLIFGCASYLLARDKNRNPIVWTVVGLLIGPFALLVLAFIKPGAGPDRGYM